jgi:hypothetical protein
MENKDAETANTKMYIGFVVVLLIFLAARTAFTAEIRPGHEGTRGPQRVEVGIGVCPTCEKERSDRRNPSGSGRQEQPNRQCAIGKKLHCVSDVQQILSK